MKDLKWDKSLSVQVQEIDEDHRRLVELFNLLNHAVAEGDTPGNIEAIIDELVYCTIWHFKHEERLMLKFQYKDLAIHKAEHKELTDSIKTLQHKFLQANKSITMKDIEFLEYWLTGHILGLDMELGNYLCEAM